MELDLERFVRVTGNGEKVLFELPVHHSFMCCLLDVCIAGPRHLSSDLGPSVVNGTEEARAVSSDPTP